MGGLERAQQAHGSDYNISHIMRAALKNWLTAYGYLTPPQPQPQNPSQQTHLQNPSQPYGGNQHGLFG